MKFRLLAIAALVSGSCLWAAAPSRTAKTRLASAATDTLIGRIGAIAYPNTPIYDGPYMRKVYNTCAAGQPLILTGWNSQWYGVRMVDGRTGWVYRGFVTLLPATVRIPVVPRSGGSGGFTVLNVPPLLQTAFSYMGVPYRWGGTSASGIDCSGFVQKVFRRHGMSLPRTAREQATVGAAVPLSASSLRQGDRLYFACHHKYVDHTGIYWGNGLFIHSSGGRGVDITPLWDGSTYERGLVAARR